MTAAQRFSATVELGGRTATGVEVPEEVVRQLGSSKKPAVQVTINEHTYPSTVATMGGRFMVPISAENRSAAGVNAGDVIEIELTPDDQPRTVTVPEDFAAALSAEPAAREFFDSLSHSNQRWHVLSIDGAKTAETRQRRIAKSLGLLRDGKAR